MAVTLFISYSKADRDYVALLAARLEQEYSITAWWFEGKQKGGRDYRQEIISRIAAAHAVIVIISAASADSPSVVKEIGFARRLKERTVPVIPLVIGPPTSESPFAGMLESGRVLYDIRDLHCINTRDGSDPLPQIMDSLTPDRHSELSFDALDLDPNTPPNHLAGKSIKGYLIDQRVSVTKQSVVFRAVEPSVGRKVAIKVIRPELANQPDYIRRFAEEARRVARLDHPHILKLYTFWRDASGACLVMPWMAGGTLEQVRREGPLALPRVARMFAQLAAAVGYAHRHGVIHRDLKPANVLRDSNDNVYLADFGIAQGASQDASGFTPGYAPPEQYQDGAPATPQLDIYSLAIVLFELLTGKLAFDGTDRKAIYQLQLAGPPALNDLRPDLPLALDAAILRALDPDPAARFSDIASFAGAIREGLVAALADSTREPTEILPLLDLMTTTNPYKGLEAFEEDDVLVFFGRDQLTRSLLAQLGAPGVGGRFLAVVGPSGSGKSSVVKAGLLPALRSGALPGSQSWFFATITPGDHMVRNLVAALEQLTLTPLGDEAVRRIIADEDGLLAVVHEALPPDSAAELLLVVDQLEELFTLSQDPALTPLLLRRLAAAVQAPQSRLRVVVTLRGDFYDQTLAIAGFGDLLDAHHERVRVLNEQELVQAIVAPAGRMGVRVDSDLLGAIVADMEDQPGALPLLQFALHRLFEQREDDRLTFAAYDQQGGVQGAMANAADRLYASLSPSQQQLARQIFLRLLVLGEDGIATRRRVRQSELRELVRPVSPGALAATSTTLPASTSGATPSEAPASAGAAAIAAGRHGLSAPNTAQPTTTDLDMILDRYGKARLLTLDFEPATREPTVEVAHEALIGGWQRLRDQWLKDAQADLRTRQRLSEAAAEWQRRDYDVAYLERGGYLGRFADLAGGGSIALTTIERRFVEASVAERDRVERDERERLERELKLAQQLATEQSKHARLVMVQIEKEREITALAIKRTEEVEALLKKSDSLRLAGESSRLIAGGSTELGLLLAIEAAAIDDNLASRRALQEGVFSRPFTITDLRKSYESNEHIELSEEENLAIENEVFAAGLRGEVIFDPSPEELAIHRKVTQEIEEGIDTVNATFSPNGAYVLTSHDNVVQLWDKDCKNVFSLRFIPVIESIGFGPDGNCFYVTHYLTASIWNLQGRREVNFVGHTDDVVSASFSPDGLHVITTSKDRTARLWDRSGTTLTVFRGHTDVVISANFSPDGKYIITTSRDDTTRLWGVSGNLLQIFEQDKHQRPFFRRIQYAGFSDEGAYILVIYRKGVQLWNCNGQLYLNLVDSNAAFYPGGLRLFSISPEGVAQLWDPDGNVVLETFKIEGCMHSRSVAFRKDGKQFLTVSANKVLLLETAGHQMAALDGHIAVIKHVEINASGTRILTVATDSIRLWDTSRLDSSPFESKQSLGSEIGGHDLLSVHDTTGEKGDNTLLLYNGKLLHTETETKLVYPLKSKDDFAGGFAYLFHRSSTDDTDDYVNVLILDNERVLAALDDGTAQIWHINGRRLGFLQGHTSAVISACSSIDNGFLLTSSLDGTARLWNVFGESLTIFEGHSWRVYSAIFSPDGERVLTASADKTARLWTIDGQVLAVFAGHTNEVRRAIFCPQGQFIATTSDDGTVKLWEETGRCITTLEINTQEPVRPEVAFSSDGSRLLVSSSGANRRVWPIRIEDWFTASACRVGRSLTEEEIQAYSVPTPLKFKYEERQCPPVYSWERAPK